MATSDQTIPVRGIRRQEAPAIKGRGHFVMPDGSIAIKDVELKDAYHAAVVIAPDCAPETVYNALVHLTAIAKSKVDFKPTDIKDVTDKHEITCSKCGKAHYIDMSIVRRDSRLVMLCTCGHHMRISYTAPLKFLKPKLNVV